MIENFKGIYFLDKDSDEPEKKFYEHGAHFEYIALYRILEEIIKKIKPRISSSVPKKKNISLKKKRASSCKRKKNIYNMSNKIKEGKNINIQSSNIKTNAFQYNKVKNKNNNNKVNKSLIIKNYDSKNLSCEKNIIIKKNSNTFFDIDIDTNDQSKKNSSNNNNLFKNINFKNYENKTHFKNNSSIINNSVEYFYNDNNKIFLNELHNNKKFISNLLFDAFPISDFSKKNDSLIFSYYKNYRRDIDLTRKLEKKMSLNKRLDAFKHKSKNKNLITRENKNELDICYKTNHFISQEESKNNEKLIIKNKMNTSQIVLKKKLESNNTNSNKRKINLNNYDSSYKMKTPKRKNIVNNKNYKNINNLKKKIYNNILKSSQQALKSNNNKPSINEYIKNRKNSKYKKKEKIKVSRNNDYLITEDSYFNYLYNKEKKNILTFRHFTNNNLKIKNKLNTSEKVNNLSKCKNRDSIERKDIKKKIKNNLKISIKEKISNLNISEVTKNNETKKAKKGDYCIYVCSTKSNKSNNDSINKPKSNKNGDRKSIISTNLTSNINSKGNIFPLYQKINDIKNA